MFEEPVEGLPFLSADDAFPRDEALEIYQILPVLQLGSSEPGTILAEMARMTGSRESLIWAHSPAAPAKMPCLLRFLVVAFSHSGGAGSDCLWQARPL
jgi:hypothetical protein